MKTELQPLGQRAHRQGLGQAGHALEQDVPAGQEPYQQPVDHGPLADDDLLQLAVEPIQAGSEVLHETTDRLHFIGHQGTALGDCAQDPDFPLRWLAGACAYYSGRAPA